MAVTGEEVLDTVSELLNDPGNVRWPRADLLGHLNDILVEIVSVKPTAGTVTGLLTLVAGTRQSLPADGIALVGLNRNMGADGLTPGTAILRQERAILDRVYPGWNTLAADGAVRFYVPEPDNPKVFYVVPPQPQAPHKAEGTYVKRPALATENDAIPLDDIYAPSIRDGVLSLAYAVDTEGGDWGKSLEYYRKFLGGLGMKLVDEKRGGNPRNRFGGTVVAEAAP